MKKLLLHTCCGPCFLGVWDDIATKFLVTSYFYNPNIQPKEEYIKRLDNIKLVTKNRDVEIKIENYNETEHHKAIASDTSFPKRCQECYRLRLEKTARHAKEKGFDIFSTTLLVSPYQQHEILKEIGDKISKEYDIEFYYKDWRPFFRDGQNMAKEMGIYRQKYCGCLLSKVEANH